MPEKHFLTNSKNMWYYPPTPTHLTPLESCQKVSKNVTNVTGDMISGKYAQTYTPIPPHTPKK